ncbi:single-stranded DNA-binding protein [Salisediminibacterium selenitireducens]|uniref:Single-stranded DNA-binding protein n=1 Tax=Bacillus selenitireducens (strain ATCC 700615 / DSM 15326 / MLS10) TaxID=439292 RepID=D6Y0Y5_BACIE|nr:single-stranded DNA-binding protein [Salisediminibacterium selenitireducens]ADH98589.1 single-strand binding protein [[Bacillus] selenitireducens MLS10]
MNQFSLAGRIANEPELGCTQHGKHYVKFQLAVKRSFRSKDQEYKTDFIPVVAWRNTAETIKEYCGKGSTVTITGRLAPMTYLPKDHSLYNRVEVIAEKVGFLHLKPSTDQQAACLDKNECPEAVETEILNSEFDSSREQVH